MNKMTTPYPKTVLTGSLQALETLFLKEESAIEAWFDAQWQHTPPPFYSSVDLRNAGFKLAPVDTNLFPAGFNHLNSDAMPLCINAVKDYLHFKKLSAEKILIVAESHTRNIGYFENLAALSDILTQAGFQVEIGSMLSQLTTAKTIPLPSGKNITLTPFKRIGNRLQTASLNPELILLNNDLSEGIPDILQNIEQIIRPPLHVGWATRLKSSHFQHYQNVAHEFANALNLDPWLLSPAFRYCGEINFMERTGEDCLINHSDILLKAIQNKYDEYSIKEPPFLVIKSDAGTYGMAVMTVKSIEDIRHLNRKERTRMAASKGSQSVSRVIIQEGVYTFETLGKEHAVAEPVIYMMGRQIVGGFYRVHKERGKDENLNAVGMNFEPMPFAKPCHTSDADINRFYAYGVVARLAAVAAARELEEAAS